MRQNDREQTWVVYRSVVQGEASGPLAVCGQLDWEKMERDRPGAQTLVRGGITNEGEAERLARGTSGDSKPRGGAK
jgi:hypothetical protein